MKYYLALNKGSSSLKFNFIEVENTSENIILEGKLTNYSTNEFFLKYTFENQTTSNKISKPDFLEGGSYVLKLIQQLKLIENTDPLKIVHRFVHGGTKFYNPLLLSIENLEVLESLNYLAPLHNPLAILEVRNLYNIDPNLQQFAVFDTAFHQTLPKINQVYALPIQAYTKLEIKRFGFHGISHSYVSSEYYRLKKELENDAIKNHDFQNSNLETQNLAIKNKVNRVGKIITLHLGSGSSLCAISNGESYQTSMGYTPNEGLPMASRSGDINLDAVFQYQKIVAVNKADNQGNTETEKTASKINFEVISNLLNKESGMLGLSGYTNNFVYLVQDYQTNENASFALDYFVERVIEKLGAYIAILNGVEAIIFTGAVGEGSNFIRQKICDRFSFLGLEIDSALNKKTDEPKAPTNISAYKSAIQVWVIPAKEELQMVRLAKEYKPKK